ncbi:hypothetical protein [Halosegnis longus]|uniref:hypothetical protein n=1 Tax=Halosegnis longus TaxID=2216012 RepID=UPI00096A8D1D|nr:hypothetical protein [Salella cibi]
MGTNGGLQWLPNVRSLGDYYSPSTSRIYAALTLRLLAVVTILITGYGVTRILLPSLSGTFFALLIGANIWFAILNLNYLRGA